MSVSKAFPSWDFSFPICKMGLGTSLAIWWLGLRTPTARGMGFDPWSGNCVARGEKKARELGRGDGMDSSS